MNSTNYGFYMFFFTSVHTAFMFAIPHSKVDRAKINLSTFVLSIVQIKIHSHDFVGIHRNIDDATGWNYS